MDGFALETKKILETERLILREYTEEDFDALYELWYSATPSLLFDFDENMVNRILENDLDNI